MIYQKYAKGYKASQCKAAVLVPGYRNEAISAQVRKCVRACNAWGRSCQKYWDGATGQWNSAYVSDPLYVAYQGAWEQLYGFVVLIYKKVQLQHVEHKAVLLECLSALESLHQDARAWHWKVEQTDDQVGGTQSSHPYVQAWVQLLTHYFGAGEDSIWQRCLGLLAPLEQSVLYSYMAFSDFKWQDTSEKSPAYRAHLWGFASGQRATMNGFSVLTNIVWCWRKVLQQKDEQTLKALVDRCAMFATQNVSKVLQRQPLNAGHIQSELVQIEFKKDKEGAYRCPSVSKLLYASVAPWGALASRWIDVLDGCPKSETSAPTMGSFLQLLLKEENKIKTDPDCKEQRLMRYQQNLWQRWRIQRIDQMQQNMPTLERTLCRYAWALRMYQNEYKNPNLDGYKRVYQLLSKCDWSLHSKALDVMHLVCLTQMGQKPWRQWVQIPSKRQQRAYIKSVLNVLQGAQIRPDDSAMGALMWMFISSAWYSEKGECVWLHLPSMGGGEIRMDDKNVFLDLQSTKSVLLLEQAVRPVRIKPKVVERRL